MKRITASLLAGALALSLVACGGTPASSAAGSASTPASSGAASSAASALSGASLAFSRDLVYYYKPDIPEAKLVKITRWAVAGAALIGFLVATVVPNILTALYLTGNIQAAGLTLPLFAYFFSKKATSQGVLWSAVIATAFVIIDFALRQAGVALPWPGEPLSVLITLGLSFVVLVIVSACTQQKMQKLDA